jgi:hypothetical protein
LTNQDLSLGLSILAQSETCGLPFACGERR